MPALLVAVAVAVAGCSFGELLDYIEAGAGTDLSSSQDPGEQAAGRVAAEAGKEKEADAKLNEGIREQDVDKVDEAHKLRPKDPRYVAYLLAFSIANGRPTRAGVEAVMVLTGRAAAPGTPEDEWRRRATELVLDAIHDLLVTYPPGTPERSRLTGEYCGGLDSFVNRYKGPAVDLYMNISADYSVCP